MASTFLAVLKKRKKNARKKGARLPPQKKMSCPTAFLPSIARFRKKWMIFGLRFHFPCWDFFKLIFENLKIFRANVSKIAGSKLQLVPFDTFLYNKLIPENTFLILLQNWPKRHLPTCPPVHLPTWNTWNPCQHLCFVSKIPFLDSKYHFSILGVAPLKCTPEGAP